jgi:predicted translin family RNA/ssDNA-binding protein
MPDEKDKQKQWYSNKDLFEMMQELKDNLSETNTYIKKYNGLRSKLDSAYEKVEQNNDRVNKLEKNQSIILSTLKRISWGTGIVGALVITAIVTALLGAIGL